MADKTIQRIFLLIALFIAVAYFVGLSTDLNSFLSGANNIILSLQGRTKSGAVSAYPSGGGTLHGVAA